MASIAVGVAKAVLDQLKAAPLSLTATYGRTYNTDRQLKDAGTLHGDVVGAGHKLTPIARDLVARDLVVQVVVRKRLSNASRDSDQAEQDRLMEFCEEIEDLFVQDWVDAYDASWLSTETTGPIDDDYAEWRQFTVIISMTFRVSRD